MQEQKFTTPNGQKPANVYDDGNIPKEDLPQKNCTDTDSPKELDTTQDNK